MPHILHTPVMNIIEVNTKKSSATTRKGKSFTKPALALASSEKCFFHSRRNRGPSCFARRIAKTRKMLQIAQVPAMEDPHASDNHVPSGCSSTLMSKKSLAPLYPSKHLHSKRPDRVEFTHVPY